MQRRSTMYQCIGVFASHWSTVSCVRAVKWTAWHLHLQPLGLNKGRSLTAFPTQLSPFSCGFHSCFQLPVPVYRMCTMRRHLGRVHSFVFLIFSPPISAFFSQTSPDPSGITIRQLQPSTNRLSFSVTPSILEISAPICSHTWGFKFCSDRSFYPC